ncbi:MAG: hypothetical protein QHI38_10280 [Armatimonadota bacterium]|nr:hypothetical protein [Armatimonadota bacterium]
MRRVQCLSLVGINVLLVLAALPYAASGQQLSITDSGKLFGITVPGSEFPNPQLASDYEKSAATAALIDVNWERCLPNDPGKNPPKYDFASLDTHSAAKSKKTRIIRIDLRNSWAQKLKSAEPNTYWTLAESFVRELAKHAGSLGISHFVYRVELAPDDSQSQSGAFVESAEALKHVYVAAKSGMPACTVIAEQPSGFGANAIAKLYAAGAKGSFDAAAVRAAKNACEPIDMFQVVAAHRELARNGDENKKLLILGGCPPGVAPVPSWDALVQSIESDLRNILTERDIYDPQWVMGELFELPKLPSSGFLAALPSKLPAVTLSAQLTAAEPIFSYVTETPYKLVLTVNNSGSEEVKLGGFRFALRGDTDLAVEAKPEGAVPTAAAPGGSASASFTVTLPKESAGRQVTLVSTVDYSLAGKPHSADAWLTVIPTPQYEVTILPFRLILDPRKEGGEQVGMSVINHTREEFEGKITLSPYKGIKVRPTEFTTKIDPLGLEGFAFNVAPEKDTAPGHYAVFVDVGGKAKEWQAVDVALVVRKAAKPIVLDGTLDDWQSGTASFTVLSTKDRQPAGKGMVCYDDSNFYVAIEISKSAEPEQKSGSTVGRMLIGIDPLIDGARTAGGGYRDDDYEYEFTVDKRTGPSVKRSQAPPDKSTGVVKDAKFVLRSGEGGSVYEAAIPWSELAPLRSTKDSTFAMSIMVETAAAEWGGGLGTTKDPRMFLPVILAE